MVGVAGQALQGDKNTNFEAIGKRWLVVPDQGFFTFGAGVSVA